MPTIPTRITTQTSRMAGREHSGCRPSKLQPSTSAARSTQMLQSRLWRLINRSEDGDGGAAWGSGQGVGGGQNGGQGYGVGEE